MQGNTKVSPIKVCEEQAAFSWHDEGNIVGSTTPGGKGCYGVGQVRTDAEEFFLTVREVDATYDVVRCLVMNPRENEKRIPVATANLIMECVKVI